MTPSLTTTVITPPMSHVLNVPLIKCYSLHHLKKKMHEKTLHVNGAEADMSAIPGQWLFFFIFYLHVYNTWLLLLPIFNSGGDIIDSNLQLMKGIPLAGNHSTNASIIHILLNCFNIGSEEYMHLHWIT